MFVFIPAGLKEIEEKSRWFEKPIAKKVAGKIQFGFEIKKTVREYQDFCLISYPYGIHLPNNLATEWRDIARREALQGEIDAVAQTKPLYTVLHGIKISHRKTGYTEKATAEELNFISDIGAAEYLEAMEEMIGFIKYLQNAGLPVAVETTAFTNFVFKNEVWQPQTYLDLRIGALSRDLKTIRERTGCKLLVDMEHLSFALNFAQRRFDYSKVSKGIPDDLTDAEKTVLQKYGIFIRLGFQPVVPDNLTFKREIASIGAKVYHVAGGKSGVGYVETWKEKITSHSPIYLGDKKFRQNLKIVLAQKPEILVLEVNGKDKSAIWSPRPANALEKSFENLCQILNEEL